MDERREVASFAVWCVGSCHGDWSPEAAEVKEAIMQASQDDELYVHFRDELERYKRERETMSIMCFSLSKAERLLGW